ncbi:hypothetical protein QF026_004799 [Streptomyces aurantiacus]|uniref:hypothetical protein n=1 Tax=Streptomyces aurantiacus TaxID=47760 RepID=UPI002790073B|nr:hypothetical protein [Streptomyces aurantiacus]MDQ0776333.1 hypothetical protein [Streptomyces aurantiacus]
MRSVQNLLSELAYLGRSIQYLEDVLTDIEEVGGRLGRRDPVTPLLEGMVEGETIQWSSAMKGHLDATTRVAETWRSQMEALE